MNPISDSEQRIEAIASHIGEILRLVGEDPAREGLAKTPVRAAKALWYLTSGYRINHDDVINQALFRNEGSGLIVVKDIEFYSLCEHHVLPFFGRVSIGYIPGEKIVGLSKIARIVDVFARRLQIQERFTAQLADEVRRLIGARGVYVVCNAQHLCMKMRGVEKQDSSTTTSNYNGVFESDPALRAEFLEAIRH